MITRLLGAVFLLLVIAGFYGARIAAANECGGFVSSVELAKDAYQDTHRIFPVPGSLRALAERYMPRVWIHPESWQPIHFEDYLKKSKLIRRRDRQVLIDAPSPRDIMEMSTQEQCATYFVADEIASRKTAPVYVQVYWDEHPGDSSQRWTYIKYNYVFDWSGLAEKVSLLGRLGAVMTGGRAKRWHRLDIHVAAILAFDAEQRFRLLTLAQHNHQQTFLPGVDFPVNEKPRLVAAYRSNELYLDHGEEVPVSHRVVPFFDDVAYLIDPKRKPWLWAMDKAYGRNAGGEEVGFEAVFIEPKHPLADFAGLLAPPKRFFGIYIGRDGPPGYNYYAMPESIPLTNFAAMGYWKEGDTQFLEDIQPLINDGKRQAWSKLVTIMRNRLAADVELSVATLTANFPASTASAYFSKGGSETR